LLFSGGVFRGVYQVGVLNALKSVGIEPDLIAGASVGSITAAMIAEAFSLEPNVDACVRIARLAGIYLSVDRLILTDRFADFVRAFTLRAADTRFSIRQADRLFRRYDQPTFYEFDRNARAVTAGIERLFYVTPYHLNAIVRAFREGNTAELTRVSNELIQRFLDRMQIGDQALGAEPLRDLIEYYVIGDKTSRSDHPVGLTIDQMRELHKIAFLATTTNITRGRLEVLGSVPSPPERAASVLVESLLASSAFPGVFRPRWSWEVTPGTQQIHQYIDGGVMDNLPVDAIATYLHRAARVGLIAAEPRVPHLIVGASLEVRAPSYALAFTRNRFRCSWAARQKRATQLGYNTKLDKYEYAERALRRIREHALTLPPTAASNIRPHPLVSMHLLPIKPQWLCGTFAFHPMLGFRRSWQAQSIAHGCATTLLELGKLKRQDPTALEHWGVQSNQVPDVASWQVALKAARPIEALKDGTCWLRSCPCPFSEKALKKQNVALKTAWEEWRASQRLGPSGATPAGANAVRKPQELPLEDTVIREVSKIHERCLRRQTHLRRI
jgi:predicted acylesterase/phospholipase RssA